jgi:hypothetical protein
MALAVLQGAVVERLMAEANAPLGAAEQAPCHDEVLALLARLKERGATRIEMPYSGSGDEGFVEEVEVDGECELADEEERSLLDWAEEVLTARYDSWWEGEGGRGTVTVTLGDAQPVVRIALCEPHWEPAATAQFTIEATGDSMGGASPEGQRTTGETS